MRLHIEWWTKKQEHMVLDQAVWEQAAARHPELAKDLDVTFGQDLKDLGPYADADILLTQIIDQKRLREAAPNLKWVLTTSAGVEHMMPLDWLPPGVLFSNNSGTHIPKVREFARMALMMLHMHLPALGTNQRGKHWKQLFASLIPGKTVCIVGFGALGATTAEVAKEMGLTVRAVRRNPAPDPRADKMYGIDQLHEALKGADFLVIATPLTDDTAGMIGAAELDQLADGASVLNIGRGPVMDNDALCDRLDSERLSGAIVDVFVPEPLPSESLLWHQKNLLIMPHMSSDDPGHYIQRTLDIFFEELVRFKAGEPLKNRIDPETGY